jgi:serine kinase of HPr protein (carbohydrate metabolism regulator)
MEAGFQLAADDRVVVWRSGDALYGRAPDVLSGWIEARGQGLLAAPPLRLAEISLAVTCVAKGKALERLPDPSFELIDGVSIPRLTLNAFEPSAPAKLRRVLEHLGSAARQGYHSDPLGGPRRAGTGETP